MSWKVICQRELWGIYDKDKAKDLVQVLSTLYPVSEWSVVSPTGVEVHWRDGGRIGSDPFADDQGGRGTGMSDVCGFDPIAYVLGGYLKRISEQQRTWSEETFGPREVRGPIGALKHMQKELANELLQGQDRDPKEYADLLLLWLDAIHRAGLTLTKVLAVTELKLEENQLRTWPDWRQADPLAPVEHIR